MASINRLLASICLAVASTLVVAGESAETDLPAEPPSAPALTEPCMECHGADGASAKADVPHLDRQDRGYLIESLEMLASGERPSKIPDHVPRAWSTEELRVVAGFYNQSIGTRPHEPFDPKKAKLGRAVFMERCETCHENAGRDTDYRGSGSPLIAGQPIAYMIEQLQAYLKGQRKVLVSVKKESLLGLPMTVKGGQAREKTSRIGDAEVEAIAHFLAANPLPGPNAKGRKKRRKNL